MYVCTRVCTYVCARLCVCMYVYVYCTCLYSGGLQIKVHPQLSAVNIYVLFVCLLLYTRVHMRTMMYIQNVLFVENRPIYGH